MRSETFSLTCFLDMLAKSQLHLNVPKLKVMSSSLSNASRKAVAKNAFPDVLERIKKKRKEK